MIGPLPSRGVAVSTVLTVLGAAVGVMVLLPMLYLAWRRLWVMVLARDRIEGSDLHMLKWCVEEDTRAWGGFHLTLDGGMPYEEVKRVVTENIARDMEQPDSTYRRGCDLARRAYVFYDDYTVEDVIEVVDDDARFFRLSDERKRELVYRFHDGRELMGALFDHTIWDGIRMFNETLTPAIHSTPFDSRWLVKARYIPVVNEAMMLYTLAQMGLRYLTHDPLPRLAENKDQHVLRHRFQVADIKDLKNSAGAKFTSALLATWACRVFEALAPERKSLRFGLIVGMTNPRFRNNYSIITVDVPRVDDPGVMAREIDRQVSRRAVEVMPLYDLISLVEIQTMFKARMVDCLFSPAVFERGEAPSKHVADLFFYIVPTSMPMYSFACSLDDVVTISTTWNCPDIDLDQLTGDATALYKVGEDNVIIPLRDETPPSSAHA